MYRIVTSTRIVETNNFEYFDKLSFHMAWAGVQCQLETVVFGTWVPMTRELWKAAQAKAAL